MPQKGIYCWAWNQITLQIIFNLFLFCQNYWHNNGAKHWWLYLPPSSRTIFKHRHKVQNSRKSWKESLHRRWTWCRIIENFHSFIRPNKDQSIVLASKLINNYDINWLEIDKTFNVPTYLDLHEAPFSILR